MIDDIVSVTLSGALRRKDHHKWLQAKALRCHLLKISQDVEKNKEMITDHSQAIEGTLKIKSTHKSMTFVSFVVSQAILLRTVHQSNSKLSISLSIGPKIKLNTNVFYVTRKVTLLKTVILIRLNLIILLLVIRNVKQVSNLERMIVYLLIR
jgi:hypothetical protein